ncbi:MAG: DNA cytosine methyltransferase [Spirochaetia bacterium]|nr:DNA cytosine methyltransferase [Spirochaetia bacterium]
MRVLIACEFSGIVRDAFLARGHDALSCDILPTERPGPHYQGDILDILEDGWDLMIAHPPCTYVSNAGAKHLYPKGVLNPDRLKKGMKAGKFFMELYNADIPKICMENPIPSRIFALPEKSQWIQPWQFGHPYTKKTYLWLKGLPPLLPTHIVSERESSKVPGNWFNKGGKDRQRNRAVTFQGIADAMATQWG